MEKAKSLWHLLRDIVAVVAAVAAAAREGWLACHCYCDVAWDIDDDWEAEAGVRIVYVNFVVRKDLLKLH